MKRNKNYFKISIFVIFTFFACAVIYKVIFDHSVVGDFINQILSLFSPLLIGIAIAYFLNPIVEYIDKKIISKIFGKGKKASEKGSRIISVIIACILLIAVFTLFLNIIIPQVSKSLVEIKESIPYYYDSIYKLMTNIDIKVGDKAFIVNANSIDEFLKKNIPTSPEQIGSLFNRYFTQVLTFTGSLVNGLLKTIFGFVIAIYILINKKMHIEYLRKIFITILPAKSSPSFFKKVKESNEIFLSFITGKLLDSFIIGVICFVLLIILNIPFALLISLIVFITNMIPFFGPFIGGAIGTIFLIAAYPYKALYFIVLILALQQFDGNILGPKILGDSTGLSPLYVIFSVIIFGSLMGIIGMFLGVPIFAVLKNIFDSYIDEKYQKKISAKSELIAENES